MTRAELLKFVDQQRASQGPDGSYELKDSQVFVYKALSKELFVGNVYLRVYNDQPDFEISEPEAFCVALVDFIAHLVHSRCATDSDVQNEVSVSGSSFKASEPQNDMAHGSVNDQHVTYENQSDLASGSLNEQQISDDSLTVPDGQVAKSEKLELVKNLQSGLTSLKVHFSLVILTYYLSNVSNTFLYLQNLLTSKPSLASIFSTKDRLLPLFECFSVPVASESNIHQLCLNVLSLLTAYAPCLEAMVADGSSLLLLVQMLHSTPNCREGVLHVLYALASTAELAWAAAKHGGVVYILELLLPLQGNNELFFSFSS